MKNIFCIVIYALSILAVSEKVYSQDELSQEIDKLESGEEASVESVVDENPEASASEVEKEIGKEADSLNQAAPAPDVLPEDLEPMAPQEEISQPAFENVPPPSENLEESLNPVQEDIAEPVPPPTEELQAVPTDAEDQVVDTANEVVPSDFENRLGRIYQQFYSEATTDDAWFAIVGDKVNENYSIQPGDTLWDISVTFFGNGHYWPKVWQVNDDITNPHSISAGYLLKFVPGQLDKAPSLQMTKEGEPANVDQNVANLEDPSSPSVEPVAVIPPPSKKYTPVLTKLPPSLPFIRSREIGGFDKDGFSIDAKKIEIKKSTIYIQSYISEITPAKMGEIIDAEGEKRTSVGVYEQVYVQLDNSANPGETFLIYSVGGKILSFDSEMYLGTPIYLQGEIKIQELTNSKENIYRAQVVKAIGPIQIGGFVSKDRLLVSDITEAGPSVDISANVVGGQFDSSRRHMGLHEVVYLDKGLSEGLRPGQILSILRNPTVRGKKGILQDVTQHIAKIKIVKTTEKSATALVLNSKEDIRKGDFAGSLRTKASGDGPDIESDRDSGDEMDEFIEGE